LKFILCGTVSDHKWTGNEGTAAETHLYFVREKFDKFDKTWKIWVNKKLILNKYYEFEGTVTEKAHKTAKDENQRQVYVTNFNVYKILDVEEQTKGVIENNKDNAPTLDEEEPIPF
jgi:hypothetical protein